MSEPRERIIGFDRTHKYQKFEMRYCPNCRELVFVNDQNEIIYRRVLP